MTDTVAERAARLHAAALVWDNHACLPQHGAEAFLPALSRFHDSGVDVLGLNIGDSDVELGDMIRLAAAIRGYVANHPEHYALIGGVADILAAKRAGKLAILLDIEGCFAMGDQLSLVSFFFDIGVRWMAMVYNKRNLVGSGVHDEEDLGLTAFGREVVAEMDRVGMLKCCSHTGYRTVREVFEVSTRPVIFSHSNVRAIVDHPRNIPDDLIDACAACGGVIGLNGVGIFLGDNDIRTQTLVAHIDYIAQRVGPRHVGLGLDSVFDHAALEASLASSHALWPPQFGYRPGIKFVQPEQLPELTEALVRKGYAESDVRGILGENLLRVADEVWPS